MPRERKRKKKRHTSNNFNGTPRSFSPNKENSAPDASESDTSSLSDKGADIKRLKQNFQSVKRKNRRYKSAIAAQKQQITQYKKVEIPFYLQRISVLERELTLLQKRLSHHLSHVNSKLARLRLEVTGLRNENRNLRKQRKRAGTVLRNSIKKAKMQAAHRSQVFHLKHKGIFTPATRALVRFLVQKGVSERNVGTVIQTVAELMGQSVDRCITQRSVQRIVAEGLIATKIQMGYELIKTKCRFTNIQPVPTDPSEMIALTFSSDSTTHRHTNYDARGITLAVPKYSSSKNTSDLPRLRSLGVESSVNHTSETQIQGLKSILQQNITLFNNSPLAQSLDIAAEVDDFIDKCIMMFGDHAADVKKDFSILRVWREEVRESRLGLRTLGQLPIHELQNLFAKARSQMIDHVGGSAAWEILSENEKKHLQETTFSAIARQVGKEEYDKLPPGEQRQFSLFLRAGCCMHKDLNAVKAGAQGMADWWAEAAAHGVQGPIILANKDNAAVIALDNGDGGRASQRAKEVSSRGGVKAATLAGMICHNKDDKKGQQDSYQWFFRKEVGRCETLQTSATRYQCFGTTSGAILLDLATFKKFMQHVHDKKVAPGFTNLEKNFNAALYDIPTITEWAVLALYEQAIGHPYMRFVRGPGTENVNILDLGPLHDELMLHIQRIIDDPSLLLGSSSNPSKPLWKDGSLDSRPWHRSEVMDAIIALSTTLPHLKSLLKAFLESSLAKWVEFTEEFAAGSIIDGMSAEERLAAFAPSTNDAMEGSLGSYRNWKRRNPRGTLHQFNARFVFQRNETQSFMDDHLNDPKNQAYLRQQARVLLDSRPEDDRERLQVIADEATAVLGRKKLETRTQKENDVAARIANTVLVFDKTQVPHLKGDALKAQLAVHRQWDPSIKKISDCKKVAEMKEELLKAIDSYDTRTAAGTQERHPKPIGDCQQYSRDVLGDDIYFSDDEHEE